MDKRKKNKSHKNAPSKHKSYTQIDGLKILFSELYVFWLVVALILVFCIFFLNDSNISTLQVQLSFAAVLLILSVYSAYKLAKKRFKLKHVTIMVMVLGIILRLIYTLYTPYNLRQHDVIGSSFNHIDYIKTIANQHMLPTVDYCQAYHPPVHHAISAFFYMLGNAFGLNEFYSLRLVQLGMVLLSSITLIFIYKIFKQLKCNALITLIGVSVFAFHPYNIYYSSFLNNDNTVLMFYVISFYFLLKWLHNNKIKYIVLLALFTAIAILTKKTALILLPPLIGTAFLVVLWKNRKSYMPYLKQFAVFLMVCAPIASLYQIRNYILFKQGLTYAPGVAFQTYANSLYNLFYIPLDKIFSDPFTQDPYNGNHALFSDYVLKSSLFGEWRFPGLENIASLLIVATLLCFIILVVYLVRQKKLDIINYGYIFLLNLIFPLILLFQMRLSTPVVCAQNFRYAVPLLISVAYFLGKAADKFSYSKLKPVKYIVYGSIIAFCVLSALFILQIGMAPKEYYGFTP